MCSENCLGKLLQCRTERANDMSPDTLGLISRALGPKKEGHDYTVFTSDTPAPPHLSQVTDHVPGNVGFWAISQALVPSLGPRAWLAHVVK
jgi:hypothetical protein